MFYLKSSIFRSAEFCITTGKKIHVKVTSERDFFKILTLGSEKAITYLMGYV